MKIFDVIKRFASQLTGHLTLVLAGNAFSAGLGFLSILIISRFLSVSDFGLFNIVISVILIASYLPTFGMDTGIIKFVSYYLSTGKAAEAAEVFRATLFVRVVAGFALAIVIFAASSTISERIFQYPNMAPIIRLAAFGVLSVSMLNYVKSVYYSYKMFAGCVILQLLVDIVKLSVVCIVIFYSKMSVFAAVGVFAFIPLLGILMGFRKIRAILFSEKKPVKGLLGRLFSYSKWTFISIVCKQAFSYIGIFMLAKLSSAEAAGTYGLALNLTYIFPILILSLKSVLLPEVARFTEKYQFEKYIRSSLKISLYVGAAFIPFLFVSRSIILFLFGPRYAESVAIFNWLLVSYVFTLAGSTITSALYSLDRPHAVAFVDLFSLIIMISGCYLLIPCLGSTAPAMLAFAINAVVLAVLIISAFKYVEITDAFT